MLKNYFKTSVRSLRKQGLFTLINVIGLSVGIAAFILITTFVRDELTFDKFHTKVDRVYRGISDHKMGFSFGISDRLIELANEQIPELEMTARMNFGGRSIVRYNDELVYENESYAADPGLFKIFDFPLLYGDADQALVSQNGLVISRYIMDKYFDGEDPIGKPFEFADDEQRYIITGVLDDIPKNSRFRFNFIKPFPKLPEGENIWSERGVLYALFSQPIDPEEFSQQLTAIGKEHGYAMVDDVSFEIIPFGDLYFSGTYSFTASGARGDKQFINIFSAVGVLLLIIACINYINSSTAKSLSRLKEIGVRKVVGADKLQIRTQFLTESFLITLVSLIIASGLAEASLPVVNELAGKDMSLRYFSDPFVLGFLLLLLPLITLMAGFYPSLLASRYSAHKAIKGDEKHGRGGLRKVLVVFQFVITLVLIFSTRVIKDQMDLLLTSDVGVNPENLLVTQKPDAIEFSVMKSVLESVPGVERVIGSPLPGAISTSRMPVKWQTDSGQEKLLAHYARVTADFGEIVELEILMGRDFEPGNTDDFNNAILVSETAAKLLPWPNPVGKTVLAKSDTFEDIERTIIGVYKDINTYLKTKASVNVMVQSSDHYSLNIKLGAQNPEETVVKMKNKWKEEFGDTPLEFSYLSDDIMNNYSKDARFGKILKYFAWMAIIIATLGTLGLSAYTVARKYKEIGIRKVLGASSVEILLRFLRGYVNLILYAMLLAVPVAYLLMSNWTQDFALRVAISPLAFIIGLLMVVFVVLITVSYESIKAARTNPVKILRDE